MAKGADLREPLGIVNFSCSKESVKWIVARNEESSQVRQELTSVVDENEEEVNESQSTNNVNLRNT